MALGSEAQGAQGRPTAGHSQCPRAAVPRGPGPPLPGIAAQDALGRPPFLGAEASEIRVLRSKARRGAPSSEQLLEQSRRFRTLCSASEGARSRRQLTVRTSASDKSPPKRAAPGLPTARGRRCGGHPARRQGMLPDPKLTLNIERVTYSVVGLVSVTR